jgi:hypothetical protein
MTSSPSPEGPGSVSRAPNLPAGFTGHVHQLTADDVQTLVIPGCAHWVAEQVPEQLLAALTTFLAPYRDGTAAAHD